MTRTKGISVATLLLFVVAACGSNAERKKSADDPSGGSSSNSESSAPRTADEQACDDLYKAQVEWTHRCGGLMNDSPYAVQRFRRVCARELGASGTENLRQTQARCSELRKSAACDAKIPECELPAGTLPDGAPCGARSQCQSRFCMLDETGCGKCAPQIKAGGPCLLASDCATADGEIASCDFDGKSMVGTCSVHKLVKSGEECSAQNFCNIGAHCDVATKDAKSGKCVANQGEGGGCDDTLACQLGLVCRSGKCSRRPTEGQACTAYDECAEGLGCDKTCQKVVYVKSGEECNGVRRCERGVCLQRVEQKEDGKVVPSGPATCMDALADGNACGIDQLKSGLVCDHFARCLGGHCVLPDATACH